MAPESESDCTCQVTVSDDGSYIIEKFAGTLTSTIASRNALEAHALARERGIDRFLVDVTEARNGDSMVDSYNFAYRDMHDPGLNLHARIAILASPGDHSHNFVETVLRNAGLNATLFFDRAAAIEHLLKTPRPKPAG